MRWAAKSYEQPREVLAALAQVVLTFFCGALTLAIPVFAVSVTHAQTALVQSVTLNAMREAARVYFQEIDTATGALTPLATQTAGEAPAGPVYTFENGTAVTITARGYGGTANALVAFSPAAALNQNRAWRTIEGLGPILAGVANNGAAGPRAITVCGIGAGPIRGQGRIEMWPLEDSTDFAAPPATWLLPGAPAAAVTHKSAGWVAVLCRVANGAVVLHVRDTARGRVIQERVPVARASDGLAPAALTLTRDGTVLFAALNDTSPGDDEGRSWIAPLDARSFSPIGTPIELNGIVESIDGIATTEDNSCWIASRSPSAGFAFINEIIRAGDRYETRESKSYTGISRKLNVHAANNSVAVAIDNRAELWREGRAAGEAIAYEAPIAALCWANESLLIGEANRIHALDADGSEKWTTPIQSGHVSAIVVPHLAYDEARFTDDDGDLLANAFDPDAKIPNPWIVMPSEITFREDAAGVETRAVRIDSENANDATWRVDFNAGLSPWLRIFPRQGRVPGWFVAGIDPSQLAPHRNAHAALDVFMSNTDAPSPISVRVVPRSPAGRTVLWLLPQTENSTKEDLRALAVTLSGPPFYWSHKYASSALQSIDDYAAVVLDSDAIDAGLVTRQELFDYVSRGGGLLLIARDCGKEQRWLAPAGVVIGAGESAGALQVASQSPALFRNAEQIKLESPARVLTDAAFSVLATVGETAAFAVRQFGRGRIAVLATSSSLDDASMASYKNRYFATDLFDWLSRSVIETRDADADGLPDDLEDRNGNGVIDAGETSKLDPDSDGDGIPDGKEDFNANGKVDAGETEPLNADTDGDGDRDGADFAPFPKTNGLENYSGETLPSSDIANVHAPPISGEKTNETQSRVAIQLDAAASIDTPLEGIVSVSIIPPRSADVGRVVLRLDTQPPGELEWFELRTTAEAELSGRRVIRQESREWGVTFEITAPARTDTAMQLVTARVRSRNTIAGVQTTTIVVKDAEVYAQNGEALEADMTDATIVWNNAGVTP